MIFISSLMRGQWNQSYSYSIPPIGDTVLRLIVVFTIALILELAARIFYPGNLPGMILRFDGGFKPYQLITHIFSYGPYPAFSAIIHLFFEGVILWFFGTELERNWGSRNFFKLFALGLLGGVIAAALISPFLPIYLYGFDAGLAAVLVAYAIVWPDRKALFFFVIPLKMKWMVAIIFVFLFIYDFPGRFFTQSGGALAAALFVYYYARQGRHGSSFSITGKVQGYIKKKQLEKKQNEINHRIIVKEEVDRLLEKISKEGIDSLTRKERKFLDRASREF